MAIGENIKKFRNESKLTQKELAEKSNISRSYLADLERDRYNPSIETLKDIAESLQVKISDLLGESKNQDKTLNLDVNTVKLNKIARYAKDLDESDQDTVLSVLEALRRAKSSDDRNDDPDDI